MNRDKEGEGVYAGEAAGLQPGDDLSKGVTDGYKPVFHSYGDIVAGMRSRSEVSPEQEEKDSKRRRAMMVLGALSDGIAGMANIFSAREGGVPVQHDPVTDRLDARYQSILDERKRLSGYRHDAEARARMADMSGKLNDEREKRRYDMIPDTGRKKYNDEEKPYGAGQPGESNLNSMLFDDETQVYQDVRGNGKKPTGIDWEWTT